MKFSDEIIPPCMRCWLLVTPLVTAFPEHNPVQHLVCFSSKGMDWHFGDEKDNIPGKGRGRTVGAMWFVAVCRMLQLPLGTGLSCCRVKTLKRVSAPGRWENAIFS